MVCFVWKFSCRRLLQAAWDLPDKKPDETWPAEGCVEISNYSTRYREGLELVLRGVSANIKGGEKVAKRACKRIWTALYVMRCQNWTANHPHVSVGDTIPQVSSVCLFADRDRGSHGRRQVVADAGAVPHHRASRRHHHHRRRERRQARAARPALQTDHHSAGQSHVQSDQIHVERVRADVASVQLSFTLWATHLVTTSTQCILAWNSLSPGFLCDFYGGANRKISKTPNSGRLYSALRQGSLASDH